MREQKKRQTKCVLWGWLSEPDDGLVSGKREKEVPPLLQRAASGEA